MRHTFTAAESRQGGTTRAAQPSAAAARVRGGKRRATRDDFPAHCRAAGKKGYAAALAGGKLTREQLMTRIAAYRLAHPSPAEAWTRDQLLTLGLVEGTDFHREYQEQDGARDYLIDFVLRGPRGKVALEPGAEAWHGDSSVSIDGQDRRALDRVRAASLAALDYRCFTFDSRLITRDPRAAQDVLTAACRAAGLLPEGPA